MTQARVFIKKGRQILVPLLTVALLLVFYSATRANPGADTLYVASTYSKVAIEKGSADSFDSTATHTLSVVEMNKGGYRFWGYYTGWSGDGMHTDMGLAYSNDLQTWVKAGSAPVVQDLRWGTVVMADGVINMFGTRNYANESYVVRLTSEDGKNFTEQERVIQPVHEEKNQNPFIFYDEENQLYRLYYFHKTTTDKRLEEKHSADITRLAWAPANLVMSVGLDETLAAPSIFYRDDKYWLFAETLGGADNASTWQTLAFVSDNPISDYEPAEIDRVLVDNDACFFPYIFDNQLSGFYSHKYSDQTWELFRIGYDFINTNQISLGEPARYLNTGETAQLAASLTRAGEPVQDVTAAASWASSDNTVATVARGKITAVKEGTVVITVSFGGVSATETIDIGKALPAPLQPAARR